MEKFSTFSFSNEAPRSKLRGIKAELADAQAYPPSLFKLWRVTMPFISAASCRVFWRRRINILESIA